MSIQNYTNQYYSYIHEWDSVYEEYAKSVGLSYTSLLILYEIYEVENCTQKILCEDCFMPKQTVNAVVTSFYKKGWIRLEEMAQDRRNKTIHLTEKGLNDTREILENVKENENRAMEQLSESERETLMSLTKKFVTCFKNSMIGENSENE